MLADHQPDGSMILDRSRERFGWGVGAYSTMGEQAENYDTAVGSPYGSDGDLMKKYNAPDTLKTLQNTNETVETVANNLNIAN